MKLERLNCKVRCDVGICNNSASFTLVTGGTLIKRRLNMCDKCMKKLYEEIGRVIIPRSPANILSKGEKRG